MVKALAITTIHRRDKDNNLQVVPASTAKKVSVFDAEQTEFDELAKLGGVRKATTDEIALAKAQAEQNGNAAFEEDGDAAGSNTQDTSKKPDSGAEGDPASNPKSKASAQKKSDSSKDDDLNL